MDVTLTKTAAMNALRQLKATAEAPDEPFDRVKHFGNWKKLKLQFKPRLFDQKKKQWYDGPEREVDCDTRAIVLHRDRLKGDHKFNLYQDTCRVLGTWDSAYDKKRVVVHSNRSKGADVDHLVPLKNVWESGAWKWFNDNNKKPQLEKIANDLENPQLLAVSEECNRAKGAGYPGGPGRAGWVPPNTAYWCIYSRAWVDVKDTYQLTVTEPERDKLNEMLATCT
ncbi:GmrSD restriction endonuclease domain-containing protein [Streptomyces sp. NPDC054874]